MKRILNLFFFACLCLSLSAHAAENLSQNVKLEKAPINRQDLESIKRGAAIVGSTCISCHTLIYVRYDNLSKSAGVQYEKMPLNIKSWPYGMTPPDLSLETEVRGANWVYTYLHSFYIDKSRPTGVNNLLVHNTQMPAILASYQGLQELTIGARKFDQFSQAHWYELLKLTQAGSISPEEFDRMTADIVNYLSYAAEPFYSQQHRLGWVVIGFLIILFILVYFLKKEYWKDVEKMAKGGDNS